MEKNKNLFLLGLSLILISITFVNAENVSIEDIIPHDFPALVPVNFVALINNTGNFTYNWNFGDGSSADSVKNMVTHIYSEMADYEINVRAFGKTGEATKTVSVSAGSPEEYINETISDYRKDLQNIKNQINVLSDFLKENIERNLDLNNLESKIKEQEDNYNIATKDSDYFFIMKNLLSLKIPYRLNLSVVVKSMNYILSEEQVDAEILNNAGAGESENSEDLPKAISKWNLENLETTFESKTYKIYLRDGSEEEYSYVKVNLNPKKSLNEIYFIVSGDSSKIVFNGNEAKDIGGKASVILFPEIESKKTVEFIYPDKINPLDLPIVISPSLNQLPIALVIVCNNNEVCEKDSGEDYKNCQNDCKKSWGGTILMLGILLFSTLIVYIILQEWYKRHYESSLFKNKNELFNLVNFMNNSENQGVRKSEIISRLKNLEWNGEQLTYAWNKLHGFRTGMWEIPIFKWVENKQVKRELEKRQNIPIQRINIQPSQPIFRPRFGVRRF